MKQSTLEHLEKLQLIEFREAYGKTLGTPMVAVFHQDDYSEDEALEIIRSGEYRRNIVVMTTRQYQAVFNPSFQSEYYVDDKTCGDDDDCKCNNDDV